MLYIQNHVINSYRRGRVSAFFIFRSIFIKLDLNFDMISFPMDTLRYVKHYQIFYTN